MVRAGRVQHRRGGFRSKARKLMAFCLGGVLLFSGGGSVAAEPVEGLLRRSLVSRSSNVTDSPSESTTVATCKASGSTEVAATPAILTLSRSSLNVQLRCLGVSNTAAPTDPKKVCEGENVSTVSPDSAACTIGPHKFSKTITLRELLGASHEVTWTEADVSGGSENGKERTLQLVEADLPRTDKSFFVGCQKQDNPEANSSCKVTVNVNARPSSVDDENVVTCAYGKDSNPKAVQVEMSEEKNTLTIDCGSDGSMQPTEYATQYCSPADEKLNGCTKNSYSDILPMFETRWWSEANDGSPARLTIPKTDFPRANQSILLGCIPKAESADGPGKRGDLTESESATTTCRVLVTVRASSSASSALFTPQVVYAASGTAFLMGLLGGSL
uniref:SRS domain-containing protein n=1 Tax=Neospora caninum (strain Liverpool) TaxID=572307 RepID=A0A0F7U635_NEOCL|nr:TPA: SRS domain-containing protein [Neospora caninum Liverpool]